MIPTEFLARMESLLGGTYRDFCDAYHAPDTHALRVNTQKITPKALLPLLPFTPEPLGFTDCGFLIPDGERAGNLPLHHAGAYYVQDPSAMATVAALPFPLDGSRVLDLCAAPGGKTTALAARIGDGGLLVSVEIVASRARALLSNVERMGLANTVVLNTDPPSVASMFDRYFDLVVVDAPCSGEGMFRKYPEAAAEWSPAGVEAAAARSRLILEDAAVTVAEGGHLLFSTCTFSEEENEETVTTFLAAHPEFRIVPITPAVAAITADGIHRPHRPADIGLTRRYYPHLAPGEGQYIALLQRTAGGRGGLLYREPPARPDKKAEAEVRAALSEILDLPEGRLLIGGENAYLVPEALPLPPRGLLRSGVALGARSGKVFMPHHHAAMAFGRRFRSRLALPLDDPRVIAYLSGAEVEADAALRGFAAVLFEGVAAGLVKCSQGRAKNHYPKGLRLMGG